MIQKLFLVFIALCSHTRIYLGYKRHYIQKRCLDWSHLDSVEVLVRHILETRLVGAGAGEPFFGSLIAAEDPLGQMISSDTGNAGIWVIKSCAVSQSVVALPLWCLGGKIRIVPFTLQYYVSLRY